MSNYLQTSKQYKGFHYSVLPHESFDYLHRRTFEIFKQIKAVFDQNKIRYMICGGTLLGAATTGKFIPWDDDFDMCVFEEDYDRAVDLLIEKMSEDVLVQCKKTESRYFHGWVKVRDVNSKIYPATESYANNGVWVDLYKLTASKEKDVPYKIAKEHLAYLKRRLAAGDINKKEYKKRIAAANIYKRIFREFVKSLFSRQSDDVYIIWSASKIILKKDWVFPLAKCTFEGEEVTTFNSSEKYLAAHYGKDFRILPAEELRRIGINKVEILRGGVHKYSIFYIPLGKQRRAFGSYRIA